jgi:hypothetical protein
MSSIWEVAKSQQVIGSPGASEDKPGGGAGDQELAGRMGGTCWIDIKASRLASIERFKKVQREQHHWIGFEEIADWCARAAGDIKPDEERRSLTFADLGKSVLSREFYAQNRCRVLFLNKDTPMVKLTPERFEVISKAFDPNIVHLVYLARCWVPLDLCRRWLEVRRLAPPVWLPPLSTPARQDGQSQVARNKPIGTKLRPVAVQALKDWYIERRDNWPSDGEDPSADRDLIDARTQFPNNTVSREVVRVVRANLAPDSWTAHGRRKPARK